MTNHDQDFDVDVASAATSALRRPTLTLDIALYESYLADSGLSPEDKRALLEALWAVIVGFVDLGFAVEPAAAVSEELAGAGEELASVVPALLEYPATSTSNHFEKAVTRNMSLRP